MFRRKKSTSENEQRPAISISGPMRITAQASHPSSSSHSGAGTPVYERFAKTSAPIGNASPSGQARGSASNARSRTVSDAVDSAARGPEIPHERVARTGASSSRAQLRAGLGISTPSREEGLSSRVPLQQTRQQQISPPTSPTIPPAPALSNSANARRMPDVRSDELDDPTPPTSLLRERTRSAATTKPMTVSRTVTKSGEKDTPLTRLLTPPSPPAATVNLASNLAPLTTTRPTPLESSLQSASRSEVVSVPSLPSPSSNAKDSLPISSTLKTPPNPGVSLEAPRELRRAKYSPLAAFGLPVSTSTSTSTATSVPASSMPSSQDLPPPLPPKPRTSFNSPTVPTLNIDASHSDISAGKSGTESARPSFAFSDRHASLQPLKTAAVELRVALDPDDLETFHSPLFGASLNTQANAKRQRDDDIPAEIHVKQPGSRMRGEASNNRESSEVPAIFGETSSRNKLGLHGQDDGSGDAGMEERLGVGINERGRGRNGRMATLISPSAAPVKAVGPPTPPSATAPTHSVRQEPSAESREQELARKRSDSASSAGSMRRKVAMYAKHAGNDVPDVPNVQQDQPQTPRSVILGQIPTPPTSVDGHGNEQGQRLTIASVLDGEHSPEVPSHYSFEDKRVRKTSSARRLIQETVSSSIPPSSSSVDNPTSIHKRQTDSHANPFSKEMNNRIPAAPTAIAVVASSSTSSADMPYQDETRGRPTPKLYTQNLPVHIYSSSGDNDNHQQNRQRHLAAPPSPPQSPPQPIAPPLSPPRPRSKSRTRSKRPGTGSSAHSQNYVPPSSASSSDGPGRSPISTLNTFLTGSGGSNGHTPRKLTKTPPLSARAIAEGKSAAEHYRSQISESPEPLDGLVDADPFAKGEVVRTPSLAEASSTLGIETMAPPLPPFARSQHSGSSSGPPSPASSADYFSSRAQRRGQHLDVGPRDAALEMTMLPNGTDTDVTPRELEAEVDEQGVDEQELEPVEPTFYPLEKHLTHVELLGGLLPHLTFQDWCALIVVNDAMRRKIEHTRELREVVLEHFLRTVGYVRWRWSTKEHIMLTFRDLNSYMRGVSIPSHQYAVNAKAYLEAKHQAQEQPEDEYLKFKLKTATMQKSLLASSCRAFTRVVLRLRAQAEAMERDAEGDQKVYQFTPPQSSASVNTKQYAQTQAQAQLQTHARRSMSRARAGTPSRPGSPAASSVSHGNGHGYYSNGSTSDGHALSKVNRYERAALAALGPRFRSPLFRLGHAPCLRVCVPNPEGVWLSDSSVLECERELKRAGVLPLLRVGDVIWDTAVGDEGNDGRMVWDGNYLIDLDYTFSRTGEVPQYLHTLAFPPSYFHRVIRTPNNPICHIDISPWGEEIAANLQLLQDRIKTETPQGGYHTVVRWIHRSKFRVRPNPYTNAPIPIPGTSLSVDPGWYGSVIIEIEGTNEGLADLQQRCQSGFPPRAVNGHAQLHHAKSTSKVWRLLRERSRPREIWLRAVCEKERLL